MRGRSHRWMLCLALGGIFLAVACGLAAQPADPLVADASLLDQAPLSLTRYLAVLEDPSRALTLADVQKPAVAARFKTDPAAAEALNFGITPSAYWLRLSLRNASARPLERMLEIGYSRLSGIQFYQPAADGTYRSLTTGSALPFAMRPYKHRYFVFPVTLPAHAEQVIYLAVQSTNSMIVPARLWAPQAFHAYERNDYIGQAWYFGMVTAMLLFNLLLFIALRDVIYLLYVNFATCLAISLAAQNGLAAEFLWPDATRWPDIATSACFALSFAALLVFMQRMLNTAKVVPSLDRLLQIFVGVFLLAQIGLAVSPQTFIKPTSLLFIAAEIFIVATGLCCAFKRQRSAYFFLAAYAMLLCGGIMISLRTFGLLPTNILTVNGLQFGSSLEMLLLSFALADRFNVIRQEKAAAQEEVLVAQQSLVEHLQSHERRLEARVVARTDELQILNHKLEKLSVTDGLTGIANRRRFDEVLTNEWARAARLGLPLALGLLDIDWFKKYNDHYGHQAGDECLREVARVFAATVCRTGDLVARYGGEEFAFIAPATDGESALGMARKVGTAIQALALPHEMSEIGCVTASIGVAAMILGEEDTPDLLIKAADEALYRAKWQGRNQVVLATYAP